jgi:hypothetical protein
VQPRGEVALAPHLSVTFSQPMVPVSSVDQVLSGAPPATLLRRNSKFANEG